MPAAAIKLEVEVVEVNAAAVGVAPLYPELNKALVATLTAMLPTLIAPDASREKDETNSFVAL